MRHLGPLACTRLSAERLCALQHRRLRRIISHATSRVPYYRSLFDAHGLDPAAVRTLDDLRLVPFTDKAALRAIPHEQRIASGLTFGPREKISTSGSTGTPFRIWRDRLERARRTMLLLRVLSWHGCGLRDRVLLLGGIPRSKNPLQRMGLLRLQARPFETHHESLLDELADRRFDVLGGRTTELEMLASEVLESGRDIPALRMVLTGGETPTNERHQTIRRAFGSDPIDIYAANEVGHIAWQCARRDRLHINADVVHVEVLDGEREVSPGEEGELVITSFIAKTTPIIRYRTGDLGVLSTENCSCGCTLPTLERVSGRVVDSIVLPSGRRVSPYSLVDPVVRGHDLERFQVIQTSPTRVEVLFLAASRDERIARRIELQTRRLLGEDMVVVARQVDEIPLEGGKFRMVLNRADAAGHRTRP